MHLVGGVDTGATTSLIRGETARALGLDLQPPRASLFDVEGRRLSVTGSATMRIRLAESTDRWVTIPVAVVDRLDLAVDVLLGGTAHKKLGRKLVWNTRAGNVSYIAAVVEDRAAEDTGVEDGKVYDRAVKGAEVKDEQTEVIEDPDFIITRRGCASQDGNVAPGQRYTWTVKWLWKDGVDAEKIPSSPVERYRKAWWSEEHENQYQRETAEWIKAGFLQPITDSERSCKFIPWSCTPTPEKTTPLRLALDFVPVNKYVACRSEWSEREVCSEQLLRWRASEGGELLDIRKAYLNIHVDASLWRFQAVRVKGEAFYLTRLAFGLSSAPRILKKVLSFILRGLPVIMFRDDVFIPKEVLTDELRRTIIERLRENGFPTKDPEQVGGTSASRVLGLKVIGGRWFRKTELDRRFMDGLRTCPSLAELAGLIGKLSPNHYPVQRWLRPLANSIRSKMGKEASQGWKSPPSEELKALVATLLVRLEEEGDPVGGKWQIPSGAAWEVWTDASNTATGYALCVAGETVEDASSHSSERERKLHINVRELDAVVAALTRMYQIAKVRKEPVRQITIFCDNRSVVSWISSLINDEPIKLQTMSHVLVDNRLELLRRIILELSVEITIKWVPSKSNLADELTRTSVSKNEKIAIVSGNSRSLREQLVNLHQQLLHKGDEIMVAEFLKRHRGEYLEKDVRMEAKHVTRECREKGACMYKTAKCREPVTPQACHQAEAPNDEVFIDFLKVDPKQGQFTGAYNLLDAHSRRLMTVLSTSAPNRENAMLSVLQWVSQHGQIKTLRCDRGREFSHIFEEMRDILQDQRFGAVLHPQSQGLIERCHRELLSCIRIQALDNPRAWHLRYLEAVRVWNQRPHKVLGYHSPTEAWNGAPVPIQGEEEEEEEVPVFDETQLSVPAPARLPVGTRVLWKGHGQAKDRYPWQPGVIKEVLPRGAYRVEFPRGGQNSTTTRVVNEDRLFEPRRSQRVAKRQLRGVM
jgi:hypothetical protein